MQEEINWLERIASFGGWLTGGFATVVAFIVRREIKGLDDLRASHQGMKEALPITYAHKDTVMKMDSDLRNEIREHRVESRDRWESVDTKIDGLYSALLSISSRLGGQ